MLLLDLTALQLQVGLCFFCLFHLYLPQLRCNVVTFCGSLCCKVKRWRTHKKLSRSVSWYLWPCVSWHILVCLLHLRWWCRTIYWTKRALCPWPLNMLAGALRNMSSPRGHCAPSPLGKCNVFLLECMPNTTLSPTITGKCMFLRWLRFTRSNIYSWCACWKSVILVNDIWPKRWPYILLSCWWIDSWGLMGCCRDFTFSWQAACLCTYYED